MKQLILCMLLLSPVAVEAQPLQNRLGSLHNALQNAANDTIRMDVFRELGFYYKGSNLDSSHLYFTQSLSIAQKLKLKLFEAQLLQIQASMLSWDNYPKALEFLLQALKIVEDPASEQNTWNLRPGISPHNERLNTSGYTHFNLATLYGNTGNTEKQLLNLIQARDIAESAGDSGLNMIANLNLGNVYQDKLRKTDSALYFAQRALNFFSASTGDKNSIGWVYSFIGVIYLEQGNFNLSKDAFQKGLQSMQEQNNLAGVGAISLSLSGFYNKINKPDSGLLYATKALETYKILKGRNGIADAFSSISLAFERQQKTDSAFAYLKLATSLHDSLNNVERKSLLAYQNANLDEQMRLKNLEKEKIQAQAKNRMFALLAGIAVFMLIAFLLYRNNLHRKKANELLQKQKEEIATQKENVEQALFELKSTQAQLIQSEKMASLGELTAGIAHEIQNPLNFVNNFSDVNKELLEELKEEADKGNIDEVKAIANDVIGNEEKINHHGKRADAIVKGMLQHSRNNRGQKELIDINALCDEYLRLSYHGLRAKDKSFNATINTDFDPSIGKINIIPQDIGRVILNLLTNAFYAVNEKKLQSSDGYEPTVSVSTIKINEKVEIKVTDNGNGIPQNIVDKIFQPFFTTKPTGQGTGLGLSLSYDIIKAHGGEINVENKIDGGAEFKITLPV